MGAETTKAKPEDDKTFDQLILEKARDYAQELTKIPEVASVAVVIDWKLPAAASAALTPGIWEVKENTQDIRSLTRMVQRIAALSTLLAGLFQSTCTRQLASLEEKIKKASKNVDTDNT